MTSTTKRRIAREWLIFSAAMMLAVAMQGFGQSNSEHASKSEAQAKPTPTAIPEQTPTSTPKPTQDAEESNEWSALSPDEDFSAVTRVIPDRVYLNKHGLDGVAVGIFSAEPPVVARHDFPGRLIAHIEWSPDSKFLLFTTVTSSGHSASFTPAFLFCVADKSFREVDAAIGSVVSPDFRFEWPDIAVMEVQRSDDKPEEEVKIPLAKTLRKMPRVR
jgi:hypothetical protein